RLGVTYDLFGTGKTVIKANYAQYYDQRGTGQFSSTFNTLGGQSGQSATFSWTDLNSDGAVEINEVNSRPFSPTSTKLLSSTNNYNKTDPTAGLSANSVDRNSKDPETREITACFSQEVGPGFGVSVTYIWRRYTRFIYKQVNGISSANYVACPTTPGG